MKDKALVEAKARELVGLTGGFCDKYLDEEHKELCERLIRKMARKREVPFLYGRPEIWAAAVVHAIGTVNFAFDPSREPPLGPCDIAEHFGTSVSTVGQKSKKIRDLFRMGYYDPEFSTGRVRASNPFANMVMVNGLIVPVGSLPPELRRLVERAREVQGEGRGGRSGAGGGRGGCGSDEGSAEGEAPAAAEDLSTLPLSRLVTSGLDRVLDVDMERYADIFHPLMDAFNERWMRAPGMTDRDVLAALDALLRDFDGQDEGSLAGDAAAGVKASLARRRLEGERPFSRGELESCIRHLRCIVQSRAGRDGKGYLMWARAIWEGTAPERGGGGGST